MARKGLTKVIYKGIFISKQSLSLVSCQTFTLNWMSNLKLKSRWSLSYTLTMKYICVRKACFADLQFKRLKALAQLRALF